MSKIICDVCGTVYPETAQQCPICGSARTAQERVVPEENQKGNTAKDTGYNYVRGGRFSKSNVKKRNRTVRKETKAAPKAKRSGDAPSERESGGSNRGLIIAALVLLLAGWLGGRFLAGWLNVLSFLAYVPLIWSIVRMYSRNIEKRRRQNAAYLRFLSACKDREHRYYKCPRCRQTVRVPRGRGRINIRCPKCGEQFVRKS